MPVMGNGNPVAQMRVVEEVEEPTPDYRAVYRAVDYSGAFGLENMLNKFTQEGWSIHKILPTGTVTDFGIVVFERWVTDGTSTTVTESTSEETSGEDSKGGKDRDANS